MDEVYDCTPSCDIHHYSTDVGNRLQYEGLTFAIFDNHLTSINIYGQTKFTSQVYVSSKEHFNT